MAQMVYDVVCGMSAELGHWSEKVEYQGKTYYFCCSGCSGAFKKSPDYHIKNFAEDHPGVMATPT